ncbi:MAG: hypothetical protein JO115_00335 [Pseudonocardiales bacterium]|nr:hypothetical protein [Pseudonocardiales bacterium]
MAAQDLLDLPGGYYQAPPAICLLHRGLGGAIRRARTRLPGGGKSPAAIIRIPRERMIGFGIASSLAHEVGHQASALLDLVPSLRGELADVQRRSLSADQPAWGLWLRWISEILADFWALSKIGISSTLGLIGIVSLPRPFVFRIGRNDPHPFPWIRVRLSCALGDALYPHPQWRQLAETWASLYPPAGLDAVRGGLITMLTRTIPRVVDVLLDHRPARLAGRSLAEAMLLHDRMADHLSATFHRWKADPARMWVAPPSLVFAVFGRARITGQLTPEQEDRVLGQLITQWALKSTLDFAELCAVPVRPPSLPARVPVLMAS